MELGVRPLLRLSAVFLLLCTASVLRLAASASVRGQCRLIGEQQLIDIEGCPLGIVKVNVCGGYCHSYSLFNPIEGNFMRKASCCRMTDKGYVEHALKCDFGEYIAKIPTAFECHCQECAPSTEK